VPSLAQLRIQNLKGTGFLVVFYPQNENQTTRSSKADHICKPLARIAWWNALISVINQKQTVKSPNTPM
jgi:hypothetical protein